jgi:hypothetical protein
MIETQERARPENHSADAERGGITHGIALPNVAPEPGPTARVARVRCKSGFMLCLNNASSSCIMCGRDFCSQHGNEEQSVCRRCRREYALRLKHEEAAYMETIRREVAESRNAHGLCGNESCENAHIVMCERCGSFYCPKHWGRYSYNYDYRTRTGIKRRRSSAVLCSSCKKHLSDYRKLAVYKD